MMDFTEASAARNALEDLRQRGLSVDWCTNPPRERCLRIRGAAENDREKLARMMPKARLVHDCRYVAYIYDVIPLSYGND